MHHTTKSIFFFFFTKEKRHILKSHHIRKGSHTWKILNVVSKRGFQSNISLNVLLITHALKNTLNGGARRCCERAGTLLFFGWLAEFHSPGWKSHITTGAARGRLDARARRRPTNGSTWERTEGSTMKCCLRMLWVRLYGVKAHAVCLNAWRQLWHCGCVIRQLDCLFFFLSTLFPAKEALKTQCVLYLPSNKQHTDKLRD